MVRSGWSRSTATFSKTHRSPPAAMLHLPLLSHTGDVMRAALYARVSTERQGRDQTIDSQLTALQAWAAMNGHVVGEDHIYRVQPATYRCRYRSPRA